MTAVAIIPGPGIWLPAAEELLPNLEKPLRRKLETVLRWGLASPRDLATMMAGSKGFDLSKSLADEALGATAYTSVTPLFVGLWTASIGDTFEGNTASEATYGSYARLSLTNNTTIFAAGSGTTTYTKTWPSDATKSWPTSTLTANTCTYMGVLSGNAGSTADKGYYWCSITSVTINPGDTPQLAQNAVSVIED
jgi:hypothetical protein